MNPDGRMLVEKLRILQSALAQLPELVIAGDRKRMFRNAIDREIGEAKYGHKVWGADKAAIGKLPLSKNALQAISEGRMKDLTVEHCVPIDVLYRQFVVAQSDSEFQALIHHYCVAIVTKDEDKAIRGAFIGAKSQMPAGWQWGEDPLARYKCAGVELSFRPSGAN